MLVPLPFASIFCFIGIALFLRLEKRYFGMGFIFSMFIVMMMSAIISTGAKANFELPKFVLLVQFLLPMFALVFGCLYVAPTSNFLKFEAIMVYVLLLVLPLEMIATLIDGNVHLASHLYLFTLYQHLQYLPVVFVSFFLIAAFVFYDDKKMRALVLFLAMWIGAYLSASVSINAILLMLIGSIILLITLYKKNNTRYAFLVVSLVLVSFTGYFSATDQSHYYAKKLGEDLRISQTRLDKFEELEERYLSKHQDTIVTSLPSNLKERLIYWLYFGEGVFESPKTLFFGHITRPDRDMFPSAHNYYLDLVYNFGLVSLIPFLYLITITFSGALRATRRGKLDPSLLILIVLVAFFVFADSSLKVGFRQPYPGMIMFFIWGVLLTELSAFNKKRKPVNSGTELNSEFNQNGL